MSPNQTNSVRPDLDETAAKLTARDKRNAIVEVHRVWLQTRTRATRSWSKALKQSDRMRNEALDRIEKGLQP